MSGSNKTGRYSTIDDLLADPSAVEAALNRAAQQAVLRHQLLGQDVAVRRDGKMIVISSQAPAVAAAASDDNGPSSSAA
jgi:hypothetical protein